MTITAEESKLYKSQLGKCCHDGDAQCCQCPKCGNPLRKTKNDNKTAKLTCTSCFEVYQCGDIGVAKENNPPGVKKSFDEHEPPAVENTSEEHEPPANDTKRKRLRM